MIQEVQRQQRIRAGAWDPITFGRLYTPEYFRAATPPFHQDLMQATLAAEREGRGIVLAAPRNHAKSSLFSFLYPLWCAVYRRKRFIVILSSSGTQAELFADAIKKEIEQNELLKGDFGPLCGDDYGLQWRNTDMLIAHARRDVHGQIVTDRLGHPVAQRAIRLVARGAGASVRGLRSRAYRPDLVIADDLETDELVATADQRLKLRNWWNRAVKPLGDPGASQTIVIGTILHHDSLLAYLLSRDDVYTTHIYKAIQPDSSVLWPERYSRETLEQVRREIGSLAFAQEYLNEPLDPATQVFKPAWWRWYTGNEVAYDPETEGWRFRGQPLELYAACDPALTGADEFVTVVLGISPTREIVVLDLWQGHLDFPEQIAHLKRLTVDWLPRTLGIEGNAYQTALIQHLRQDMLVPIRRIMHAGAKANKTTRIVGIAPYVEGGQVYLRAATATEPGTQVPEIGIKVHAKHWPLFEQATQYPAAAHDDRLDCFEMAIGTARVRKFFDEEGQAL